MKKHLHLAVPAICALTASLLIACSGGKDEPRQTPTVTPYVTAAPTDAPTNNPTAEPTNTPGETPDATQTATQEPTAAPTPTKAPTATPTEAPTAAPSETPEVTPTEQPDEPTATPTSAPTATDAPTATPTQKPTSAPTPAKTPTATPTKAPTATPTPKPTPTPTPKPTPTPTPKPTPTPTPKPTPTPTPAKDEVTYQADMMFCGLNFDFESGRVTTKYVHDLDSMGYPAISHLSASTDAKIISTGALSGKKSMSVKGYLGLRQWGLNITAFDGEFFIFEMTFKPVCMDGPGFLQYIITDSAIPESDNSGNGGWIYKIQKIDGSVGVFNRQDQKIASLKEGTTYKLAAAFRKGEDSYDFFVDGVRVSSGNKWLGPVTNIIAMRIENNGTRDKDANGFTVSPMEFVLDDVIITLGKVLRSGEVIPTPTPSPTPTPRPETDAINPVYDEAGTPYTTETKAKKYKNTKITQFLLAKDLNPVLPFNISCNISGTDITAVVPAGVDLSSIRVKFTSGGTISCNNVNLVSGSSALDLRTAKKLDYKDSSGNVTHFTLKVEQLNTGLPSISVCTDNFAEITSKYDYIGCSVYAGGGDPAVCDYSMTDCVYVTGQVKCRGNSSYWYNFPKKSYTLKLSEKAKLAGMSKSKNWTLSANVNDKTLIRNNTSQLMAEALKMEYVMQQRLVDLWLNGNYWGTYVLAEKIEIEKNRVNIQDYDPALPVDKLGYLFQWEGHVGITDTDNVWVCERGSDYYVKWSKYGYNYLHLEKPAEKYVNQEMLDYVYNYLDNFHQILERENYEEISKVADLKSFARWYIIEDFMMNTDSGFWCSCWMYLQDGVLHMGPVWDFDNCMGNNGTSASGNYLGESGYYKHLLKLPEFRQLLKETWAECKDDVYKVGESFDKNRIMISQSVIYNYQLQDELNEFGDKKVAEGTYEECFNALVTFFYTKYKYYDRFINLL